MTQTKRKTTRDWFREKSQEFQHKTGKTWEFVDPSSNHPYSSLCSETLMRMGIEKRYFGLTSYQEDLEIANSIIIRDLLKRRIVSPLSH
jgi:hypothetical protein